MDGPLADVAFLAASDNRVRVLTALLDGPAARRDLQEAVDASRSTVARILDDAATRGWVDSEGTSYWLTPLGEGLVTDFRSFLSSVEGYHHLGELVNHLPPPAFDLDFRHLRDAEVVEFSAADPMAPFSRATELYAGMGERYRGLNSTALPDVVGQLLDRVEAQNVDFEQVLEDSFLEIVRTDDERTATWNRVGDRLWEYEGTVPINLQLIDDTVMVWLGPTRDEATGLLVSENDAVRSWAEELYREYQAESVALESVY